ncbi:unnamed protein product [Meloidogyne enterolobii]|uniref:Uncharacterized protein n=1 Tax=Meloidogyne enterolobii TaxID=390850 RepID=A0ACB1AVX4_MELEN
MLISVGGYIINIAAYQAIYILIINYAFDPILLWQLGFIPGILLNIGAASNAIVLYFTSSEYRKAFKKSMTNLAKFCGFEVSVTKVSPMLPTGLQKKTTS